MKRGLVVIVFVLVLLAALISGCSSNSTDGSTQKEAATDTSSDNKPSTNEPKTEEQVTIKYANWNLGTAEENNIERQMIQAFEAAYPNIKIQIDESMDYSKYGDSLTAAAAAGALPDVIMLPTIPLGLTNEWLLNIKDFAENDPEWANIPKPLEQATYYGDGIYAVPAGMFLMGYFVNSDLFAEANIPGLEFAPSFDDLVNAAKTLNKPAEGIIGLAEEVQIPEWYPASINPDYGWYTWDGQKYNVNDPLFIEGIKKAKELFQGKYVYDSLTEEQKAQYNAGWYGDVWNQGKIAIRWDGTWSTREYATLNFDSKFIGVPGGRTTLVGDFMGIAKSSEFPEQAFLFAKYMTFGKEGILKRIELNTDGSYTSLPLTTDPEVLNQYFEKNTYEGIKEAYETIDNGIIEGVKIVPGYIKSRWEAPSGIKVGDKDNANLADVIWNSMRGDIKIEDYADQINKLANEEYIKAAESIKALTE